MNTKHTVKSTLLAALIVTAFSGAASAQTAVGPNAQATGSGTLFIANSAGNCQGMSLSIVGSTTLNGTPTCTVNAQGSTVVGQNALASGAGSTATGEAAAASGLGATAHGAGANAPGGRSVANGAMSFAGTDSSVAIGAFSQATGTTGLSGTTGSGGTAVGFMASAVNSGTALGVQSSAVDGSVALGAFSVADQANTVSVGSFSSQRRIVNVAAGVAATDAATVGQVNTVALTANNALVKATTAQLYASAAWDGVSAINSNLLSNAVTIGANAVQVQGAVSFGDGGGGNLKLTNIANGTVAAGSSDAVTGDQLYATNQAVDTAQVTATQALSIAQQTQAQVKALTGRVDGLDHRVTGLESRLDGFDRRVNAGIAVASAMGSAMAPSLAPGESALLGAMGTFRGQTALSMGVAHTTYSGQSYTAKVSSSSIGTAFSLGGAVKF